MAGKRSKKSGFVVKGASLKAMSHKKGRKIGRKGRGRKATRKV